MNSPKVVLVSGGTRGLGLATVEQLLISGYHVATFSRTPSEAVTELNTRFGARLWASTGDLSDPAGLENIVHTVEHEFGPIWGLVNNAGIAVQGVLPTMAPQQIENLVSINLTGTLLLTRLVLRRMILRSQGSIVNISSIIGIRGYAGLAAYSATKSALDGMSRALAREMGSRNIRVNSVAPGYLETDMTQTLDSSQLTQLIRRTPLGRLGQVEDVVPVILFLLSPAAGFITGQTIVIDGGLTC